MTINLPSYAEELFNPHRYKILYGGRDSAKSHTFATVAAILGAKSPKRILCLRQYQRSIDQSVYRLLTDKIEINGLSDFYDIQKTKILGTNGTEFSFAGLQVNPESVKSFEGCDICWIEEANDVPEESWRILIPTIRKEGSEIWVGFNPVFDDDPTYLRFVANTPESAFIRKVSYKDNPFLTQVSKDEIAHLKKSSYAEYDHVYGGNCRVVGDGAVFNTDWFSEYSTLPSKFETVIQSWDTAYKADQHNDPSACITIGQANGMWYVLNILNERLEYPELKRKVIAMQESWNANIVLIEDKASGQSLIQELRNKINIIPIQPVGDKETRARVASAVVETGRISLPNNIPWVITFKKELTLFPDGKHDDCVDALSQFINWSSTKAGRSVEEYREAL